MGTEVQNTENPDSESIVVIPNYLKDNVSNIEEDKSQDEELKTETGCLNLEQG